MISILVPVFNEERFVVQALDSILSVIDLDLEIIVVDDGSEDGTYSMVADIKDSRVSCYKNPKRGKVSAYNFAYSKSRGDCFILFAGDDLIVSGLLEQRINVLAECRHLPAISLCKVQMFSENKKYDGIVFPKHKDLGASTGGGMAFNKAFAELVFPIPESLPNEDSWIKMFVDFYSLDVFHVPKVGLKYRIHENNSFRRDVGFSDFSERLKKRESASDLFLESFGHLISEKACVKLAHRCIAQRDRYSGRFFRILFNFAIPFRERISLIFYSHGLFFSVRNFFYSFFSGR